MRGLGRPTALIVAQCRTLRLMTKTCLTLNAVQAGEKRMNKVLRFHTLDSANKVRNCCLAPCLTRYSVLLQMFAR